ncbi:MAG: glycosyltransferase family 9 protein [Planctomycetota bacterium]
MPIPDDPPPPVEPRALQFARAVMNTANASLRLTEGLLWPQTPRRTRKVGVFRVGMIGDVLATLPALQTIRAAHPDAELVFISSPGGRGRPGAAELLDGAPSVDRLLTYHAEDVAGPRGQWRLLRRLRRERFDRLYVLPQEKTGWTTELRNQCFLRAAGVRWARGFAVHNARGLPRAWADAHHRATGFVPEWERHLDRLAERAGLPSFGSPPPCAELPRDPATLVRANALASEHALDSGPLLVLAPGAKLAHKRWPTESFGAVAQAWRTMGGTVCVLGAPSERDLATRVADAAGGGVVDLCGTSDLLTSAELLRRARALVTNDTGTMHLGAAVGTPLVAIFSGSNRPRVWDPYPSAQQVILREPVGCAPCFDGPCAHDRACLTRIRPERVLEALAEVSGTPSLRTQARRSSPPAGQLEPKSGKSIPAALPRRALAQGSRPEGR